MIFDRGFGRRDWLPAMPMLRLRIAWRALTHPRVSITNGVSQHGYRKHHATVPMEKDGC